jgi:hypothetical protein
MEEIIKKFYIENKEKRRWKEKLSKILQYNDNYKSFKDEVFYFLDNPTDYQIIWHVLNNTLEVIKCKVCNNPTKFNRQFFYHETCSLSCSAILSGRKTKEQREIIVKKARETSIKKYGIDSASKLDITKEKKKNTCLKKYGVENPLQNKEIQKKQYSKMKETNLQRYGVESTLSLNQTREKFKKTMIEKYGVDHPWKNKQFREKSMETMEKKYGARFYSKSKDWIERFEKHEWGNKYYDYSLPSGKIVRIQGYEKFAIDFLLKSYREDDLVLEKKPLVKYKFNGKYRNYKCDIFIEKENRIIEVKSNFTYNLQLEKNELKAMSCIESGYKFEFWIIDRKGNITINKR